MHKNVLTLVATGLAGFALGAGIGTATADTGGTPRARLSATEARVPAAEMMDQMHDEMHALMRDKMPPDLAAACDKAHASMGDGGPGDMGSMMGGPGDMGSMMGGAGDMGSMMGGTRAGAARGPYARHHR